MDCKHLNDKISLTDKINTSSNAQPRNGFWAKTEILGGYGLYTDDKGMSQLGEVVFDTHNMVPLVGVQYAMEMICGAKGYSEIRNLYDLLGIGSDAVPEKIGANLPHDESTDNMPYPYGQKVCLFGVGIGGAGENNITSIDVNYNEDNVSDIVPLRFSPLPLTGSDANKYYGKKAISTSDNTTVTAYYLKRFSASPIIKHLYKDGVDGEDGNTVTSTYFNMTENIPSVESFTEFQFEISTEDVREWFNYLGKVEETRINSIGLYTAVYNDNTGDYSNIQLFSKLNIPSEPLSLTKKMTIIYRVYGS